MLHPNNYKKSLQSQEPIRPSTMFDPDQPEGIGPVACAMLLLMGLVLGMVLMQMVHVIGRPSIAQASIQIAQTDCRFCHLPSPARNIREYDRRRTMKVRRPDLKELTS